MRYLYSNSAKITIWETRIHRVRKSMFLPSLRQDHFSNYTIKRLVHTPPLLYFKKYDISSQIQQKQPSHTPAVASFRDTYAPTSKKYVFTDPNTRSFHSLNNNFFRSHSSVFIFTKMIFLIKFRKNDSLAHLRWPVSEKRTHRLPKNIFFLILRQYHFCN